MFCCCALRLSGLVPASSHAVGAAKFPNVPTALQISAGWLDKTSFDFLFCQYLGPGPFSHDVLGLRTAPFDAKSVLGCRHPAPVAAIEQLRWPGGVRHSMSS